MTSKLLRRAPLSAALPLAVAAALLAAGTAHAQSGAAATPTAAPARNDLLSIYREALARDPVFASARYARDATIEREPQARALLGPTVNVGLGGNVTNFDSSTLNVNRTFNAWGPTLTATMPLYRPQLWDSLGQARQTVLVAEAQLAQARQDLILRTSQAYFDALAAEDTLQALDASKKAVSEQLAQARREFEVGTKTIVDTTEAQARFDQIVAQEAVARGDLIVKRNALRSIIGRDPGVLVPLRDAPQLQGPAPADVDAWAQRAEEGSYGVAIARANAEIAKLGTQLARDGYKPTLDLSASVNHNRASGSSASNASSVSTTSVLGVSLNWPIYTSGLTQSRVREALANEDKSTQDLESARRNAAQSARQSYTGVSFGLSQVRALESAEVSAQKQLESTRLGFQVGVRINLDVLNAVTQVFSTQRDLKRARYDFLLNGLRLESAAGALDDADLERVNALLGR